MNIVSLIGRMTKDPELRYTSKGQPVASFNLAINRPFKSNDNQQEADFIPCVVWGTKATNVEKYCSKGSLVGVNGRLQSRSYTNSHNQTVFVLEVICDSVQFLETKKNNDQKSDSAPKSYVDETQHNPNQNFYQQDFETGIDIASDDLPF